MIKCFFTVPTFFTNNIRFTLENILVATFGKERKKSWKKDIK